MGATEIRNKLQTPHEDNPAFRILHNDLSVLTQAIQANTSTLSDFVQTQSELLATFITEVGRCPTEDIGSGRFHFEAQTADIELVIGLYAWFPLTAANAQVDLGTVQLPLAPGWSQLVDINLLADRVRRVVTWENVQPDDEPFVVLFTRPAPGGIPGLLHG